MPFTPATLRSYVDANIEDNSSEQVTPADVRNSFKVAADVMGAVYPDGAASDSADDAAASAVAADLSADAAAASAVASAASAVAAAASAASVDGSTLLTKAGNFAGLTSIPTAIANLGLTNRVNRPGTLAMWPKNIPPAQALERNGAAVSRTTYADLFAVIGTDYGAGNGTTTFNVPDDRGLSERGWDNGRGLDSGRAFGSYQADAIQNHTHSGTTTNAGWHGHGVADPGHNHEYYTRASSGSGNGAIENTVAGSNVGTLTTYFSSAEATGIAIYGDGDHNHAMTTGNPSVGGAAETRAKSRAYLPIIYY
jgi:microcystin-dependent protein